MCTSCLQAVAWSIDQMTLIVIYNACSVPLLPMPTLHQSTTAEATPEKPCRQHHRPKVIWQDQWLAAVRHPSSVELEWVEDGLVGRLVDWVEEIEWFHLALGADMRLTQQVGKWLEVVGWATSFWPTNGFMRIHTEDKIGMQMAYITRISVLLSPSLSPVLSFALPLCD